MKLLKHTFCIEKEVEDKWDESMQLVVTVFYFPSFKPKGYNDNNISNFIFSVKTDLLTRGAISRLSIAFASNQDSGNYTCSMRNAQASVIVHILNGMQIN